MHLFHIFHKNSYFIFNNLIFVGIEVDVSDLQKNLLQKPLAQIIING
jgi:hypothetical protein